MEFKGEGAEIISRVVNGALFILHGKNLSKARIYLGFEEWYALRCMDYTTRAKIGFDDTEPALLGCRVFQVMAENYFAVHLDGD